MHAAQILEEHDISVTVADARFCKPLDIDLIKLLAKEHEFVITVEEGSIGGFGSHVSQFLSIAGLLDGPLKVNLPFMSTGHSFHDFCFQLLSSTTWLHFSSW